MAEVTRMDFSEQDMMILKEVGNIGAGQSSILLAKLVKREILLKPEEIKIVRTHELYESLGSPKPGVFGVFMALYNDLSGDSMVFFLNNSLSKIIDIARGKKVGTTRYIKTPLNKQLIRDIGTKALVPYIKSLSDLLDLDIKYTVPIPIYEHSTNLLNFLENNQKKDETTILIKANLEIIDTDISDDIIVIIRPENLEQILEILKQKSGYL